MASLSPFLSLTKLAVAASAAGCDPNSADASKSGGKLSWWAPPIRKDRKKGGGVGGCGEHGDKEERVTVTRRSPILTAEKARLLRREMRSTETWHDAMYHSAMASRLASPDDE